MATKQVAQQVTSKDASQKLEEYIARIDYSDRYADDEYEYRHVILPRQLLKMVPKHFFNPDESGTLRLLAEPEWRGLGISQSLGWEHYEVHAPEPHVLLFRRPKDFVPPPQHGARYKEGSRRK